MHFFLRCTVLTLALIFPHSSHCAEKRIKLPENDVFVKMVKYVEEEPVAGYKHAPDSAFEDFRDLKFGIRIHWGLYSNYEWRESWNFLSISHKERQAYQELCKTWNPVGFNADEWMKLFKERRYADVRFHDHASGRIQYVRHQNACQTAL